MRKLLIIMCLAVASVALVTVLGRPNLCKPHATSGLASQARTDKPVRIVSLAPNLTEVVFALGLDRRVAAVSSDSDYPPEAACKPKVGTFWQPDCEAIISARPDLVLALSIEQQKAVADSLTRLGYKVLTLKIEKVEELFTAIEKIGAAAGCRVPAGRVVNSIKSRMDELQARLGSTEKVKTLWVVQCEPLRVAGRNTFVNELIEMAAGENAIGPTISRYPQIGTEQILVCGAEVIIHSAMGENDLGEQQGAAKQFWCRYASLPAVRNNRIYVVESDTVLRLGPRLPEGMELLARHLHGARFTAGGRGSY
jgi:iron complex transport system substrate-binding protein